METAAAGKFFLRLNSAPKGCRWGFCGFSLPWNPDPWIFQNQVNRGLTGENPTFFFPLLRSSLILLSLDGVIENIIAFMQRLYYYF